MNELLGVTRPTVARCSVEEHILVVLGPRKPSVVTLKNGERGARVFVPRITFFPVHEWIHDCDSVSWTFLHKEEREHIFELGERERDNRAPEMRCYSGLDARPVRCGNPWGHFVRKPVMLKYVAQEVLGVAKAIRKIADRSNV